MWLEIVRRFQLSRPSSHRIVTTKSFDLCLQLRFPDGASKNASWITSRIQSGGIAEQVREVVDRVRPSSIFFMSNSAVAFEEITRAIPSIPFVKDDTSDNIFEDMATCADSVHFVGTRRSTVTGIINIHRKFRNSSFFDSPWLTAAS
jgi:hypothetical protein